MKPKKTSRFELIANKITQWTGSSPAFGVAAGLILAWIASGPVFGYSDTWQLVINTSTTIITFLMVFLIQKTQNKDSKAIQLKLDELIAASKVASNRMVDIEDLNEGELDTLHKAYQKLTKAAKLEDDIHKSYSIDAMKTTYTRKKQKKSGVSNRK